MRTLGIVVMATSGDVLASVPERSEPGQVQALVPELSVQRLDEGILDRLAGFDEAQPHASAFRPLEHRAAGAFRPVVENDLLGQAVDLPNLVQVSGEPGTRDREIDDLARTEPAMVINVVEDPEPATIDELIAHEVQRPALHRPRRHLRGKPISPGQFAPLLRPHLQPFGSVEAPGPLVVDGQPLPAEQGVQPQIAVAAVLRGEHTQALAHGRIVALDRPVLLHRAPLTDDPATPPFAQALIGHEKAHGSAFRDGRHQFFARSSFIADTSSIWSATIRFNFAFSASNSRSRRASDASRLPNFLRHV